MGEVVSLVQRREVATEAMLREKPSEVLPDPTQLVGSVAWDTETSGLFFDAGDRVCAVSVAYRLDYDNITYHSFPFDQGNAADKGFETLLFPDTPLYRKRGVVGLPKGDPEGKWDWDTDYNLDTSEWITFCRWLEMAGKRQGLTGQNQKFDVGIFRAGTRFCGGVELEKYIKWDTMVASARIWPYSPTTALKPTAARIWGAQEVEEAQVVKECLIEVKKRYGLLAEHGPRFDLMPWVVNGPYAAADAVTTLRLAELQEQLIFDGQGEGLAIAKSVQLLRVLARMERRGLGPLDKPRAIEIADRIDHRLADLRAKLPFFPYTAPRAATYFFEELGLAPWRVSEKRREVVQVPDTRKGAVPGDLRDSQQQGDLSAPVSERMADAGVPFAAEWNEITVLSTANRMFYRGYADLAGPGDRLRTTFKQSHVRSGRLSVERIQLHAIPKHLGLTLEGEPLPEPRSLFLVPEGKRRVNLDLKQAELRIAASMAGCEIMNKALVTGADFHGITTERVFGITKDHPDWKFKRDIGKKLTFSSIFMVGPVRFQAMLWEEAGVEWSLRECKSAVYTWRDTYPEFKQAFIKWEEFAERHHYVPLVDGSPAWMTQARDYPSAAWSRRVQSSLALFVQDWLIAVEKLTARHDALLLSVHDSVLLELPEDQADEITQQIIDLTAEMWMSMFKVPGGCDLSPFI